MNQGINTYNEKSLHVQLKDWYARPGDAFEVPVGRFIIDIVRDDLLIEIQTRNFSALKKKLNKLLEDHQVHLVYPVEQEKWLIKLDGKGKPQNRRKSPKRGTIEHVFQELVYVPQLMNHDNFSLEVILIQAEELRKHSKNRGWRRKGWMTEERRLLNVVESRQFQNREELLSLIPDDIKSPFTTADLSDALNRPRRLMQQMVYCLRAMEAIYMVGKQGNAILYERGQG